MIHEKNPVNQYRGRRNRAEGKTFEGLIEQSLHYYNASGAAAIHKMPEPMNPTKSLGGGKFVAFFAKKAMADYRGTLQGGRAIVFEAKHTVNDRMDFGVGMETVFDFSIVFSASELRIRMLSNTCSLSPFICPEAEVISFVVPSRVNIVLRIFSAPVRSSFIPD